MLAVLGTHSDQQLMSKLKQHMNSALSSSLDVVNICSSAAMLLSYSERGQD